MATKTASQDDKSIRDEQGHEKDGKKPSINSVTREAFHDMHISGFTESRINTIMDYRDNHGPFKSVSDIEKVPMIGHTMAQSIGDHFTFD